MFLFCYFFFESPDGGDSIAATLWKSTGNGQQGAIQLLWTETKDYPCHFVVPIKWHCMHHETNTIKISKL